MKSLEQQTISVTSYARGLNTRLKLPLLNLKCRHRSLPYHFISIKYIKAIYTTRLKHYLILAVISNKYTLKAKRLQYCFNITTGQDYDMRL